MVSLAALAGLALAAFLAATPIPFQSEIVFLGLLATEPGALWLLVAVASVANTAGSCLTYALGRGVAGGLARWPRLKRWLHLPPEALERAARWFNRWGVWVLLFSWAPGGDIACAMAGALKTRFWLFLALVGMAKTLRYAVVGLAGVGVLG